MSVEVITGKHVHGNTLRNYTDNLNGVQKAVFDDIVVQYEQFRSRIDAISSLDHNGIREFVLALNEYRRIAIPVFDGVKNSGQTGLGSTIMEEFFYLLFQKKIELMHIEHDSLFVGKGNSYVSLSFTPSSFSEVFSKPNAYIHTKDQDFVLGVSVQIQVSTDGAPETSSTVIPVIAIECKTYLERNMLDSCAATASRLKTAMPYCIYIVASEYMKMDDATPELTDIDEVYILCKAKNTDREQRKRKKQPPIDIDASLVIDLYERASRHLNAIWWNPDTAVETGKIINRPS